MRHQSTIDLAEDQDVYSMTLRLPEPSRAKASSKEQQDPSVDVPQAGIKQQTTLPFIVQAREPLLGLDTLMFAIYHDQADFKTADYTTSSPSSASFSRRFSEYKQNKDGV